MTEEQDGACGPRTLLLVCLVSAAMLGQEVALLRVLAIAHWHHAAHLIVAVALCGFGAAGTTLAIFPRLCSLRVAHRAAAGQAVLIPGCLVLARLVPFNALAVGWEMHQWLHLLLLQALFMVPFSLGALAVQIPFALAGRRIGRVYGVGLVASGAGALGVLPLLGLAAPEEILRWLALLPALGAAARRPRTGLIAGLLALLLPWVHLPMTPYKPLATALLLPDAEIVETRHRPTARLDLVRAPALREVHGMSLIGSGTVPPQTVVYVDGEPAGALVDGAAGYVGWTLTAAPFSLVGGRPRVLVLGGAGNVEESFPEAGPVIRISPAWTGENPRDRLRDMAAAFDVVLLRASVSVAMREDALLTVGGLRQALGAVTEDGVLCVLVPVQTPPREEIRLIATAREVSRHVSAARSLDLLAVFVRHRPSTGAERSRLVEFCAQRGFDVIDAAGDAATRLHESGHRAYQAALRGQPPPARYRTAPATDDSPYFHRFLRWSRLPRELRDARTLGAAHVDWGTVVVLVAAAQATALGLLLVLVPLVVLRRRGGYAPGERRYALLHFAGIGVAYALVEMAFLGRLTLSLGSAEYAAGAVLCAFLVGSGLGSLTGVSVRVGAWAAAGLALGVLPLLGRVHSLPLALLAAATVAFPMGMPFPGGLRRVARRAPPLVPWALAVNGCASVAVFAFSPLLASDIGFSGMTLVAALLYVAVGAADRGVDIRRGASAILLP